MTASSQECEGLNDRRDLVSDIDETVGASAELSFCHPPYVSRATGLVCSRNLTRGYREAESGPRCIAPLGSQLDDERHAGASAHLFSAIKEATACATAAKAAMAVNAIVITLNRTCRTSDSDSRF